MLQELSIRDFVLISTLDLTFDRGMTVLTGETGAGKSMLIDALNLLSGQRGSVQYIRTGADKCVLRALFHIEKYEDLKSYLIDQEIEVDDDHLLLQRSIHQSGKTVCRVNGQLVTLKVLKQIGSYLIDIHGQHDHHLLRQQETHLALLDELGMDALKTVLYDYQQYYQHYQKKRKQWQYYRDNTQHIAQRIDMLRFQTQEIEAAELVPDEEVQLEEEREKWKYFDQIYQTLQLIYQSLEGSEVQSGLLDQVGSLMQSSETIASVDISYGQLNELIQTSYFSLQEALSLVQQQFDQLDIDEERQHYVEERLYLIQQLKKKYGPDISSILSYYQKISEELEMLVSQDQDEQQLEETLIKVEQEAKHYAYQLHDVRLNIACQLEQQLKAILDDLALDKARLEIQVTMLDHLTASGMDEVAFYWSANPGETLQLLNKVASGGELSRITLAFKMISALNEATQPLMIFDEIDTGVSGNIAQKMAELLYELSQNTQVICITHLPQLAAIADHHYFIYKEVQDERTQTRVDILSQQERVEEIARMISGSSITTVTKTNAQELLELAQLYHQKNRP